MGERMRWLIGYVRIRVPQRGARFFTIAHQEGLGLFSISWRGGGLEAGVLLPEVGHLRRVVRRSRVRVELTGQGGLPFLVRPMRRRPALVAAAGVFLVAWFVLGQMVLSVTLDAPAAVAANARAVVAKGHLAPFTFRRALDTATLAQGLRAIPGVIFARVTFDGTRAIVTVRPGPPPTGLPGMLPKTLVAARSGVVLRVVVFQGVALVSRGEAVRQGEILVRGSAGPPPEMLAPGVSLGAQGADGEVDALVEVTETVRLPLVREEWRPSGSPAWRLAVALLGRTYLLLPGPQGPALKALRRLGAGSMRRTGFTAVLEEPLHRVRLHLTPGEAARKARQVAEARCRAEAPDARWLGWRQGYKIQKNELVLTLTGTAEENIARPAGRRSTGTSE